MVRGETRRPALVGRSFRSDVSVGMDTAHDPPRWPRRESLGSNPPVRIEPEDLTAEERYLLCERLTTELRLPVPEPLLGLPQGIVRIGAVCVFKRGGA